MILIKLLKLPFCWPVFRINSFERQIQKKYIFVQDFLILLYNHTPWYGWNDLQWKVLEGCFILMLYLSASWYLSMIKTWVESYNAKSGHLLASWSYSDPILLEIKRSRRNNISWRPAKDNWSICWLEALAFILPIKRLFTQLNLQNFNLSSTSLLHWELCFNCESVQVDSHNISKHDLCFFSPTYFLLIVF